VVALSPPSTSHKWGNVSFVSTLYLCPILDRLLKKVPHRWRAEVRLGLQEALVNAVKHGNQLDTQKVISVRYTVRSGCHWWIIADQGKGFKAPCGCPEPRQTSPLTTTPLVTVVGGSISCTKFLTRCAGTVVAASCTFASRSIAGLASLGLARGWGQLDLGAWQLNSYSPVLDSRERAVVMIARSGSHL
jgi:anti-sigma regulatory factor (Ser/Thr protein kinase)